jgi:hypothetical protein
MNCQTRRPYQSFTRNLPTRNLPETPHRWFDSLFVPQLLNRKTLRPPPYCFRLRLQSTPFSLLLTGKVTTRHSIGITSFPLCVRAFPFLSLTHTFPIKLLLSGKVLSPPPTHNFVHYVHFVVRSQLPSLCFANLFPSSPFPLHDPSLSLKTFLSFYLFTDPHFFFFY